MKVDIELKQGAKQSILIATLFVSLIAIIGKIVGFSREAVIAAYYGTDSATDAFFFAQSMPTMLFPAICSSMSTAFISIYIATSVKKGQQEGDRFASHVIVALLLITVGLSGIAIVFSPYIVTLFAPGFSSATIELATHLTRITMFSFVFMMAYSLLAAILNSRKIFYTVQVAELIGNISIIVATILTGKQQSVEVLTLTVVAGHLITVLVLISFCWKQTAINLFVTPFHIGVKGLFILALPILLGNGVIQIHNIVSKAVASIMTAGVISALHYSSSLNNLVITIFITSLSTVLYPTLIENASSGDMITYKKNLLQSLLMVTMFLFPISIITFLFSVDIVSLILERGNFNRDSTELTAAALQYYAIMYCFVAIREVLIRAYYAIKDTRTPMINSSIAIGLNIIFNLLYAHRLGIAGIALGASLSHIVASFLLLYSMKKSIVRLSFDEMLPSIKKIILSGFVTTFVLYLFSIMFNSFTAQFRFVSATVIGFSVYISILKMLKCDELIYITARIPMLIKKYMKKDSC